MQFLKRARRVRRGITFRYVLVTTTILFLSAIVYGSMQVSFLYKSEQLRMYTRATNQANFLSAVVPESVFLLDFVVISVMMKRKKPLFRNVASGIARKWGFLHFTLILITTLSPGFS